MRLSIMELTGKYIVFQNSAYSFDKCIKRFIDKTSENETVELFPGIYIKVRESIAEKIIGYI